MNVNKLTCTEINEVIARLRDECGAWHRPSWSGEGTFAPDYCHDWAAVGPCLEEMVNFDPRFEDISRRLMETGWQNAPGGDPLTEAIARAYYAWRMEEK